MEAMVIHGGKALHGEITVSGSKNAVLPILAATTIHGGKYVLHGCPDITDVQNAVEILQTLGAQAVRVGDVLTVDTRNLCRFVIPGKLMMKMRASVLFLGPLLARFGAAVLTMPGGCPLGRRPVDLHMEAVSAMGTAVTLLEDQICCRAPRLHGCTVHLAFPSVGATENALMAAVACCGTVTIRNAAREPEISDLITFLQAMGADIRGSGTSVLTVLGGTALHDADHTVMPDRIETATYLCAAAGCGGEVTLHNASLCVLTPVAQALRQAGCTLEQQADTVHICSPGRLQAVEQITTAPYPGFPTDAQAPLMAALLRAEGESCFTENIFDSRFGHVPQLRRFGAEIRLHENTATVCGVQELKPSQVEACDLRAAAALVLAALQIPGETAIFGLKHLYRGYDNPEGKLGLLGAQIRCIQ